MHALIENIITHGIGAQRPLDLARLTDTVDAGGGLDGLALIRLMMTSLNACDEATRRRCAREIAAHPRWEHLLSEAVSDLSPASAIRVARDVVAERIPSHPLAECPERPAGVRAAFDLNGSGNCLRMPFQPLPEQWRTALLIGVDRPTRDWATVTKIGIVDGGIDLEVDQDARWLEPARAACPPTLLVLW